MLTFDIHLSSIGDIYTGSSLWSTASNHKEKQHYTAMLSCNYKQTLQVVDKKELSKLLHRKRYIINFGDTYWCFIWWRGIGIPNPHLESLPEMSNIRCHKCLTTTRCNSSWKTHIIHDDKIGVPSLAESNTSAWKRLRFHQIYVRHFMSLVVFS